MLSLLLPENPLALILSRRVQLWNPSESFQNRLAYIMNLSISNGIARSNENCSGVVPLLKTDDQSVHKLWAHFGIA